MVPACGRTERPEYSEPVMKTKLTVIVSVLFFGAAFGLLGAFSTLDSGWPLEYGTTIGAAFGMFIGAVFGGARGPWIEFVNGPADEQQR
jgi:hypothetical protein